MHFENGNYDIVIHEEEKVRFQIVKCASAKYIHERALSRLQSSTSLQLTLYIYMRG